MKTYPRLVEIYVTPATRNKIKKAKGTLTYDTFLNAKLFGVLQ